MGRTHRRVQVTASPNTSYPDAVVLDFTEDCPYCGQRHQHGNPTPEPDTNGTYGHRVEHCANHTHAVTATGRRARVTSANLCRESHHGYVLIPTEADR